jgi:DNA-binding response OmpR family regulator/anti-sigma regulatory factor (Ser/Thr protein kinase)
MNGFQTAELVKRHSRTSDIPIIFLTAYDDLLDRAPEGYAFGAADYIAKPFDPEVLRAKVRVFLELHQKTTLLERQAAQLEQSIEQLRLSRAALDDAQRIANLGNWEYDPRSGRVRGSRQVHEIFGEPVNAPLPDAATLFGRLQFRPRGVSGEVLMRSATRANFDGELMRRDGTRRDVVVHVEPRSDTLTIVGTIQDVTEPREAQRALDETTRELERERELIHVFHEAVAVPEVDIGPNLSVSHCYRPADAAAIGGDWYDVLPLRNGELLLVIGDVAGHGLPAASAMAEIRTSLRLASIEESRPGRLIEHLDRYMATFRRYVFATMLLVRFDDETGLCTIASAGHLPALEFGSGDVQIRWAPGGPPLGALSREREESTFVLEPDRCLLLYTDGLVERRGELIDDGIERLEKRLSVLPTDSSSFAEATVRAMCSDTDVTDDIAVLVLQRMESQATLHFSGRAEPSAISQLRRSLRAWLRRSDVDHHFVEDVVLATVELATNACTHAYRVGENGDFNVDAEIVGGQLTVAVSDHGKWREQRGAGGGRGLALARDIGFDVTIEPSSEGTTVKMTAPSSGMCR